MSAAEEPGSGAARALTLSPNCLSSHPEPVYFRLQQIQQWKNQPDGTLSTYELGQPGQENTTQFSVSIRIFGILHTTSVLSPASNQTECGLVPSS